MTALERVRRARVILLVTIAVAAVLWAGAGYHLVALFASAADLVVGLPLGVRQFVTPLAVTVALAAAVAVVWRGRRARALPRVALFIEERAPALQFALATAIDAETPSRQAALDRVVAQRYPEGVLRAPVRRALSLAAGVFLTLVLAMFTVPAATRQRVLNPRAGDVLARPGARPVRASRLVPIVARVNPPAYAHQSSFALDDPISVSALPGSRVEILGRGAGDSLPRVSAGMGGDTLPVTAVGDTWRVDVTMPSRPAIVRLADRGFDRLLALEPGADLAPRVTLEVPARDSTYRLPRGQVVFQAKAEDDIGLAAAWFEFRHSSGGGERFTTRRWIVAATSPGNARSAAIRVTVRLDTLRLGPGDVVHVRAMAMDANDVTGPDTGWSDTRTLRIDDPGARDTIRINPSQAAPLDTTALSQRMLIVRAETLLTRKPRLVADSFTRQSVQLGGRQAALRTRVESVISDLENIQTVGFVGRTEISTLLHQASDAMRDAETELRIAHVETALPPMRRALRFLEQARQARRLYLRGVLPPETVDLPAVRLQGTDSATVALRRPRDRLADPRRALLARLDGLAGLAGQALVDSLTVLRVDALTAAPDVADPLARAIDAARRHADPGAPLGIARRRLERSTVATPALGPWQGGGIP